MPRISARIDDIARSPLHLVTGPIAETPEDLLVKSGHGDRQAFAELYDQVAGTVYGLARRVVRDPQLAQDIAQEALVEVWRMAPRFDPAKGRAMSWIAIITHRRAVDRVRSEQARHDRELAIGPTTLVESDGDEISARMLAEEDRREMTAALSTLTDAQRQVIELAFYDGHTYREVADLLGIPIGTAKTRIRDGLIKLRDAVVSTRALA